MSLSDILLVFVTPWIMAGVGYVIGRWHERRITDREYSEWMNAPLQPLDAHEEKAKQSKRV